MIRSRRLGGVFLLQGMLFWVHGRFVLADCFAVFRSFSDPLCLRFPLVGDPCAFRGPETLVRGWSRLRRVSHKSNVWRPHEGDWTHVSASRSWKIGKLHSDPFERDEVMEACEKVINRCSPLSDLKRGENCASSLQSGLSFGRHILWCSQSIFKNSSPE